jgi:hypothetical protein
LYLCWLHVIMLVTRPMELEYSENGNPPTNEPKFPYPTNPPNENNSH